MIKRIRNSRSRNKKRWKLNYKYFFSRYGMEQKWNVYPLHEVTCYRERHAVITCIGYIRVADVMLKCVQRRKSDGEKLFRKSSAVSSGYMIHNT